MECQCSQYSSSYSEVLLFSIVLMSVNSVVVYLLLFRVGGGEGGR